MLLAFSATGDLRTGKCKIFAASTYSIRFSTVILLSIFNYFQIQPLPALGQWRKDAVFSTWLFALATNLYRSDLRRIPARTVSLEDIPEPADARASDGGLEDHDRDLAVRRAVGALPPKYREALILFYFHDMDVTTAARSLGLPEGTVKARLFRGREILRSKLPQLLAVPRLKEA
jgi:RNA polymerase sigma-70 factor (ECF subfamily)